MSRCPDLNVMTHSSFRIPDAINMLDNERTRFINGLLFFVMGWQLSLMILSPKDVVLPFQAGTEFSNFSNLTFDLLSLTFVHPNKSRCEIQILIF